MYVRVCTRVYACLWLCVGFGFASVRVCSYRSRPEDIEKQEMEMVRENAEVNQRTRKKEGIFHLEWEETDA